MNFEFPKIVIVGGGSSGWISAAILANEFGSLGCEVQLVESADTGTIGVGEATIPPIVGLIRHLGIDEREFVQATQATFKLGIHFKNWRAVGESYPHPFGDKGWNIDGYNFYQCWLKAKQHGDASRYTDFAPCAVMAAHKRFFLPFKLPKESPFAKAEYAWHFDAGLVASFLKTYSLAKGVIHVTGNVVEVGKNREGFIEKLKLHDGREIAGDFFIDCSGFRALLIDKAMGGAYEHWQNFLPCDRAVAVQSAKTSDPAPLTVSEAREAGWQWTIPLQHRTGNGYVFSSSHLSDDEAVSQLLGNIAGETFGEPRVIPFTTGCRKEMWKQNCLAVGLSAGFLEPLESTSIHLVMSAIALFIDLMPRKKHHQRLADEFNRKMEREYADIRDFIVLHYCATQRNDSEFWRHCGNMPIPDSLAEKIELFKAKGSLLEKDNHLFRDANWQCIFEGMGIRPQSYNPIVDACDFTKIKTLLEQGRALLRDLVKELPTHEQFILENCPAKQPRQG